MEIDADAIARAIRLGEDSSNEFKSVARVEPDRNDVAKSIVAFANAGGGRIWYGIESDGSIGGTRDAAWRDRMQLLIDDVCAQRVVPAITCTHRRLEYRGEVLIVTEVPAFAPGRPFRTLDGRYYVRQGASARLATPEEVRHLSLSAIAAAVLPDEASVAGTGESDLDFEKLSAFHQAVYQSALSDDPSERSRLLRNLRIVAADGALTVMGTLCFAKDPQARFLLGYVTCAREPGVEPGSFDTIDRKDFRGTLERQIRDTEDWIARMLPSPAVVRAFEAEGPMPALPLEAVREIVRNAVAHRDYSIRSQILVTLYDDRLEITSPGLLLNTLTLDAIRTGAVHVERNPLVCSVLAKWGLMTERGTGVLRAIAAMRRRHLPEPEFEVRGPTFHVTLRLRPKER